MDHPVSSYTDEKLVLLAIERTANGPPSNLPSGFQVCDLYTTEPKNLFQESAEKGVVCVFTKLNLKEGDYDRTVRGQVQGQEKGKWVKSTDLVKDVFSDRTAVIGWKRSFEYKPYASSISTQKYLYLMEEYTHQKDLNATVEDYVLCKIEKQLNPNWRRENDDTTLGASNSDSQELMFPLPSTNTQPKPPSQFSKDFANQLLSQKDISEGQIKISKKRKLEEEDDVEYTGEEEDDDDDDTGEEEVDDEDTGEEEDVDDDEYSSGEEEEDDDDDDDEYTGEKTKGKAKKNNSHGRGRGRGRGRRSGRGGGQAPSRKKSAPSTKL